jgi:hypothetical protein
MLKRLWKYLWTNFSVYGISFNHFLFNLHKVSQRCEDTNLVLKWEKFHFKVQEGIVLGHKISSKGIEVDEAKIEAIERLPPPRDVKGIKIFLGHVGFYRRFIKNFSKIARPLTNLLQKNYTFNFDETCLNTFTILNQSLLNAPIIKPPKWRKPFDLFLRKGMKSLALFFVGVMVMN